MTPPPRARTLVRVPERRAAQIVLAALALGLAAQYLFVRERAGLNVLAGTALFLAAAWWLRRRDSAVAARDAWLPASALAFAALCAVRTDAPLVAFDALAALVLSLAWLIALRGVVVTDLPLPVLGLEVVRMGWAVAWRMADAGAAGVPVLRRDARGRASAVGAYAAGLALALPFLVVFGSLFSSADAVFERGVEDVLQAEWVRQALASLPARIGVAALAAWAAGGALASLAGPRAPGGRSIRAVVGREPATAMIAAIAALFAFFVALQVAYLFGGRDTLDAAGIPYSTYARRGFFELVAVAGLVAALLFVLDLAVRAKGRAYVASALLLIALTLVVLASAAMRMDLYQRAYGWTELRFYASAAIAYLAIALAVLAWSVARARMEVALQRLVLAALAVALAVNAMGPSETVARASIARYFDPASLPADAERGLDLPYLVSLGDGAIPTIVASLPLLSEGDRGLAEYDVRVYELRRRPPSSWQSWNLDRLRAEQAVR